MTAGVPRPKSLEHLGLSLTSLDVGEPPILTVHQLDSVRMCWSTYVKYLWDPMRPMMLFPIVCILLVRRLIFFKIGLKPVGVACTDEGKNRSLRQTPHWYESAYLHQWHPTNEHWVWLLCIYLRWTQRFKFTQIGIGWIMPSTLAEPTWKQPSQILKRATAPCLGSSTPISFRILHRVESTHS